MLASYELDLGLSGLLRVASSTSLCFSNDTWFSSIALGPAGYLKTKKRKQAMGF